MPEADEDGYDAAVGHATFVLALRERGVRDTAVLRAMEQVPRERFVPVPLREHARRDIALPLPCGQTMTAPTKVAAMLSALAVPPGALTLEIGTGSGYLTALLTKLGSAHVRSLERHATLAHAARENLGGAGLDDATVEIADGLAPIGEGAFDRILVNGRLAEVPAHLSHALAPDGRLVGVVSTEEGACLLTIDRAANGRLVQTVGARLAMPPLVPGRAGVV